MNLISFQNAEELKSWELYGYELVEGKGCSCKLCGKTIKNVFKIKNGEQRSELGSECVRKVAVANNIDAMKGITVLPEKQRKQVRINKDKMTEEEKAKELEEMWKDGPPF